MRVLTQEELLEEAEETEKVNLALLEEMLKLEAKQKPVIRKERTYIPLPPGGTPMEPFDGTSHVLWAIIRVEGPAISFVSTPKGDLLTFTQTKQLPDELQQKPITCTPCALLGTLSCVRRSKPSLARSSATGLRDHGAPCQVQGSQDRAVVCHAAGVQSPTGKVSLTEGVRGAPTFGSHALPRRYGSEQTDNAAPAAGKAREESGTAASRTPAEEKKETRPKRRKSGSTSVSVAS
jgi:hypothetical protein